MLAGAFNRFRTRQERRSSRPTIPEMVAEDAPSSEPSYDHIYNPSELDNFIAECDAMGGWGPNAIAAFGNSFECHRQFRIDVGQSKDEADPFSDAYFSQQMQIYSMLSGRPFDQQSNELLHVDVDQYVHHTSARFADVCYIAHHVSTIAAALQVAGLSSRPKVLDIGCGTGLSCEIMAYCGADVTAVDINPIYAEIVNRRARRLQLPIRAISSDIVAYASDQGEQYDAILFFEALHHIPKPWELLERLTVCLKPGGKIIVAGEPIEFPSFSAWWPHWGVRRSAEDVYVARKYGWFETGFSEQFLGMMFNRAGFQHQIARLDRSIVGGGRIDIAFR